MKPFGAYVHARPDGRIFYVGKGKESRARSLHRNSYHAKIVNKYGAENIRVGFVACSSEGIAFTLEIGIIKCLRRMGVALTNQTDGGEGCTGLVQTAEAKAKVSRANKGRKATLEHRAKISRAGIGNKYCLGKTLSAERRAKASATLLGRARPDAVRLKISASKKGVPLSASHREKLSIAKRGSKQSAEHVAKRFAHARGNQYTAGRCCICKDGVVKVIKPEQLETFIAEGWKRGRK